jgi:hypothetical protein
MPMECVETFIAIKLTFRIIVQLIELKFAHLNYLQQNHKYAHFSLGHILLECELIQEVARSNGSQVLIPWPKTYAHWIYNFTFNLIFTHHYIS